LRIANEVGIRYLAARALNPEVRAFYEKYGFIKAPQDELLMLRKIQQIIASTL
jgi:hypothetical protein